MSFSSTAKFQTAPYYELTGRFGMQPRYRLSRIDDRSWALPVPHSGMLRLNTEDALQVMAVDALLWLRHELGCRFNDDDVAGKAPVSVLRMVRDAARTLLAPVQAG